jgi:hypothetical protein
MSPLGHFLPFTAILAQRQLPSVKQTSSEPNFGHPGGTVWFQGKQSFGHSEISDLGWRLAAKSGRRKQLSSSESAGDWFRPRSGGRLRSF